MPQDTLNIERIDYRRGDMTPRLAVIRQRLSLQGAVVSEEGRRRTEEGFGRPLTPREVVEQICGDVLQQGLSAVLDYSKRIDRADVTPETLRVTPAELAAAHAAADPALLQSIRRIRANIHRFQQAILHRDVRVDIEGGGYLIQRYLPLRRVGICVPGGAAAYPSTVLMTAVPALAAGVSELAVVAPPTKFGAYNTDLLATCHELGVTEVYRVGGAQAVAALAYGIDALPRVDKIVGPGNLFVALAKQHVFGTVDIDSIAGPSEVVVVADETTSPQYAAADLIAQAEHAPGASLLVTDSERVWAETAAELSRQLAHLERGDLARQSLEQFGALILVPNAAAAAALTNEIAPEHLHIATADAETRVKDYVNAGAIFLGPYSPVAVGDYAAGPSHVLPTGGTARFASGLSANSFLRAGSVIHFTRETLTQAADDVRQLADREGLTAHRASVDVRLS
ncbi:MAG: histidinol dehydrogenase [Planctomycetes bacterium]|nr:histidinol dehydrogenase [Planctomycetota bacterium]